MGGGGDGTAGRVLAQLLAEMDGVASRDQRSAQQQMFRFAQGLWGSRGRPAARLQQLQAAAGGDGRRGVLRPEVGPAADGGGTPPCLASAVLCSCSLSNTDASDERMSFRALDGRECVTCPPAGVRLAPCVSSSQSHACAHEGLVRCRVFVLGATNRPGAMDPAVLRPGRLDALIEVRTI